jgi:uncharacterized protein YbdZ (MbtH family)
VLERRIVGDAFERGVTHGRAALVCYQWLSEFAKNWIGLRPVFCNHVAYMSEDEQDQTFYRVVTNHEEQYSIRPADRATPLGRRDVGKQGLNQECPAARGS